MTRKEIAKDFFIKVVLPVFLAGLLFAMFKPMFTKDGVTNFMYGSSGYPVRHLACEVVSSTTTGIEE